MSLTYLTENLESFNEYFTAEYTENAEYKTRTVSVASVVY